MSRSTPTPTTINKNKKPSSYYSRFQTKKRRRIEGKTDYTLRRKLIQPNYKSHSSNKYRLVVRTTNTRVILQVTQAYLNGDKIISTADSKELSQFGINFGLKNISAHYLCGLLLSKKIKALKNSTNQENKKINQMFLDIGLKRSTKGAKVFVAMKGCVDGGLNIPYNCKIFMGYNKGDTNENFDTELFTNKVTGKVLKEYMLKLKEDENKDLYKKQFSKYIELGINEDNIVDLYEQAIEKINDYTYIPKVKPDSKDDIMTESNNNERVNKYKQLSQKYKLKKISTEVRKLNIHKKLETINTDLIN
ncbi:60S ribosomal protein L5 [Cucumispora dikerogammari]|nr:60S ribosomal protein L5 [Cucumispora dikerogammari]